ncbi:MAG: Lrp/AsnC family transcriptional regulator [Roseiarcus sp.]|jgi:Lrp/AsnC family transcriptional regulator
MDNIDRKILAILQEDATTSVARISERVGLSQTPCWKRIQRLEASGVILQRVALLAPEKLGLGVTAFVLVESGDHSAAWSEQFASEVARMSGVMEVYRMAGDADYILRVVVPDIQSYDHFYKRLIAIASIKKVTSRFVMERIKQSTAYDIRSPRASSAAFAPVSPA